MPGRHPDAYVDMLLDTVYGGEPGEAVQAPGPTSSVASNPASALAASTTLPAGGAALTGGALGGALDDWGGWHFNIKSPSNPNGAAVSGGNITSPLQGAFDAAVAANGGKVIIPDFAAQVQINATVNINSGKSIDIEAQGVFNVIKWTGADSTPVFHSFGWGISTIAGVKIDIGATSTSVIVWDIDGNGTFPNSTFLTFNNCYINLETGAASCIGWRLGHGAAGGLANIQGFKFDTCTVFGNGAANGSIGWSDEFQNHLNSTWINCYGANLAKLYTNSPTAGSQSTLGGYAKYFYGCGGTSNLQDFEFVNPGNYHISGGRYETGKRFLGTNSGSGGHIITVEDVHLAGYTPADNIVFNFTNPGSLTLVNVVANGAAYTGAFITTGGFTGIGRLTLIGCSIRTTAEPPYTLAGTTWIPTMISCSRLDSTDRQLNYFADRAGSLMNVQTPAFSATPTVDFTLGNIYAPGVMTANVTAITVSAIWKGMRVRYVWLQNGAGGFTVAYPASHKLSNAPAFVTTLNTTTIDEFESYDGTNLRLVSRSTGQT